MDKMEAISSQQLELMAHLCTLVAAKDASSAGIVDDVLESPARTKAEVQDLCVKLEDRDFRKKMVKADTMM